MVIYLKSKFFVLVLVKQVTHSLSPHPQHINNYMMVSAASSEVVTYHQSVRHLLPKMIKINGHWLVSNNGFAVRSQVAIEPVNVEDIRPSQIHDLTKDNGSKNFAEFSNFIESAWVKEKL